MDRGHAWETGSHRSSRSAVGGMGEIVEEPGEYPMEDKVYVAVAEEFKYGKSTLTWVLQNSSKDAKIVITHVHVPAQMIPMMGTKFRASQLIPQQVNAYRQGEREKMEKNLDEYLVVCSKLKVRTEKLVIEMDDIIKGLEELISLHGITKLVMGAAADKHYSRKMKEPRSKTAIGVLQRADPSCKIWFICKGNLICTREGSMISYGIASSPATSLSSTSSLSDQMKSLSLPPWRTSLLNFNEEGPNQDKFRNRSISSISGCQGGGSAQTTVDRLSKEGRFVDPWDHISVSSNSSGRASSSANDDVFSNSGSSSVPKDENELPLPSVHESDEDIQFASPRHELVDLVLEVNVYDKLKEAQAEVENLKTEAFEEYRKRQKAERQSLLAHQKVRASEALYLKEVKQRKEIEQMLAKEKQEMEQLRSERDEISEKLLKATLQKSALQQHIADSDRAVKDLEDKLAAARYLLSSLQAEYDQLQHERDDVVKDAEELRNKREQMVSGSHEALVSEFTFVELEQATDSFSKSRKIGEGGFGSVYKGSLRNTTVAIKMLHPQSLQGRSEFHQEVAVLSRVRHPNLVTLIGACSEAWALVYEFLPNGSLEDRLVCANNTPPLTWQVRTRIIREICSALIFLHSNKPHPVVHGDLKPANILLDANFLSKLGDFGICRLLIQSNTSATTLYHTTNPRGTFAYMDPELMSTGELTPRSDVYSFGIIILRLLTGKPPIRIATIVEEALEEKELHSIIDASAGDWPFVQANQLAHLGLRCCQLSRKKRPDVMEVGRVIEPLMEAATSHMIRSPTFGAVSDDAHVPSYFICPIFQEIMRDPHIAADGFTYEAEAIKGWLEGGHDTSPMTNLKLSHCELIPNHALRSVIQEFQQQQQPI
ncbi:U-box domain-containing protein 33-like isoform X1 [Typha latifolia]|uniref:U-box domain-containing protein 33-like isoform X1 n=2 Tax=Typha latifolia TaxID=4733 RepID=UPI003C2B82CB